MSVIYLQHNCAIIDSNTLLILVSKITNVFCAYAVHAFYNNIVLEESVLERI